MKEVEQFKNGSLEKQGAPRVHKVNEKDTQENRINKSLPPLRKK